MGPHCYSLYKTKMQRKRTRKIHHLMGSGERGVVRSCDEGRFHFLFQYFYIFLIFYIKHVFLCNSYKMNDKKHEKIFLTHSSLSRKFHFFIFLLKFFFSFYSCMIESEGGIFCSSDILMQLYS